MLKKITYLFPLILLFSIVLGGITGLIYGQEIIFLKSIGEIYLRLIFTAIVPLLFFSIASSVAKLGNNHTSNLLLKIILSFIATSIFAAIFMLLIVHFFQPVINLPSLPVTPDIQVARIHLTDIFTAETFYALFTHKNILPLVIFAILLGMAANVTTSTDRVFINFLNEGALIFTRLMNGIMYFAPIGFFAYFATTIAELGPKLLTDYIHIFLLYYLSAIVYFFIAFTIYAFIANSFGGVKIYWKIIWLSVITSIATCSSIASIPANLIVAKNMRLRDEISQTVIPLGAVLHKDGTVLGAIVKISFLFSFYHLNFSGITVFATAIVIAFLVGVVMGAIPSGGMLGELLILSYYGFPSESLMLIAAISIIIDPIATMLNVTGDINCAMLVSRWSRKKLPIPDSELITEQVKA